MDVTDTEMRAAELVYERDYGEKVAFSDIPEEERGRIIQEIRDRVERIERFVTQDILVKKIGKSPLAPRRVAAPALLSFLVIGAILLIALVVLHFIGLA
jgi:hypothetical protein